MWFLDPTGNEEGFVAGGFLLQPLGDLAGVFAILVLGVGEATASSPGRRLGIELPGNLLL